MVDESVPRVVRHVGASFVTCVRFNRGYGTGVGYGERAGEKNAHACLRLVGI